MGTFDEAFLEGAGRMPDAVHEAAPEVLSLKHPRSVKLANRFLLVSNLHAKDGGKEIVAGNEKVIRARLADARFFWQQDLKKPLDEMASALAGITFHEKLGTQKERVERIAELAFQIAGSVDAVPEDARRAAQLCKADLVSGMVGEFPELQGLMGPLLCGSGRHQARDRAGHRAALQAEGPDRHGAEGGRWRRRWRSPWRWRTSSTRWWASGDR
jgi:glycyl-tRNA synthetase beta chain